MDAAILALREARSRPAVLKLQLAKLRSEFPRLPIFVFEGDDDKIVYYQWIARIRDDLSYLPLPCRGKDQLLRLLDSVRSDLTGISAGVSFFIDRDFDDMKGREDGEDVYMTDFYSVENYLVTERAVQLLLQNELHCQTSPQVRDRILSSFNTLYSAFLEITREPNMRLYMARKKAIPTSAIPDKISKIANLELNSVSAGSLSAEEIIALPDDMDIEGELALKEEFGQLNPAKNYRGKFALMFFNKWIQLICEDNNRADRGIFAGIDNSSALRVHEITLSNIASKAELPAGLREYINDVQFPITAIC